MTGIYLCFMCIAVLMFIFNAFAWVSLSWGSGSPVKGERKALLDELAQAVSIVIPDLVEGGGGGKGGSVDTLEGKTIYITGPLILNKPASDPKLEINLKNALMFSRRIERYFLIETAHVEDFPEPGVSKKTTYYYEYQWASKHVDSSGFFNKEYKGKNPTDTAWLQDSGVFYADASIGGLRLSNGLFQTLQKEADWHRVPDTVLQALASSAYGRKNKLYYDYRDHIYLQSVSNNIGDLRYTMRMLPAPETVSILARVRKGILTPLKNTGRNSNEKPEIILFLSERKSFEDLKAELEKKLKDDIDKEISDAAQYMQIAMMLFFISCCWLGICGGFAS